MHVSCTAGTAVDSHKHRWSRAGGQQGALYSTLFTLHNWMWSGVLQHSGLRGTGRKMDEVSSTFTSADFVLIQEYDTVLPLLPHTVTQCSVISFPSQAIFREVVACSIFLLTYREPFEMTVSISIESVRENIFSLHISTHIVTPFDIWLISLSWPISCKSKVILKQISELKGAPQLSKPLSISIKLHCHAFNKKISKEHRVALIVLLSSKIGSFSLLYHINNREKQSCDLYEQPVSVLKLFTFCVTKCSFYVSEACHIKVI